MVRANGIIVAIAVKIQAVFPCMAENPVQQHADAHFFRILAQGPENLLVAQDGVHRHVIAGVVAVVAAGFEDGV